MLRHYFVKKIVSCAPCYTFYTFSAFLCHSWNIKTEREKFYSERCCKFTAKALVAVGFLTAYSVIEVRRIYFCAAFLGISVQHKEQSRGIGTTRKSYEDRGALVKSRKDMRMLEFLWKNVFFLHFLSFLHIGGKRAEFCIPSDPADLYGTL